MSDLSKFAKKNPAVAALLKALLLAFLNGTTQTERQSLADAHAELDSDGDGVPDDEDAAPQDAAVTTRKPRKAAS